MQSITSSITPFLTVNNGKKAVEFYANAFGATELVRHDISPDKLMSKISIEGADFWLGDEQLEFENASPATIGGSPVRIILTTSNADNLFESALNTGATQICPMTTEEDWRIGKLKDPFGHIWEIGYPL